jgi:hypothetical protein
MLHSIGVSLFLMFVGCVFGMLVVSRPARSSLGDESLSHTSVG